MRIIFYMVLVIFSLVSCTKENKTKKLTNQELKRSILEYDSIVKSPNTDLDYILHVQVKNINDSISRYYIGRFLSSSFISNPNLVVYKIMDKDVVFTFENSDIPDSCQRINNEQHIDLIKRNFPKEYRKIKDNPNMISPTIINDEGCFILTFYKDKLIGKTYQFVDGSPFYKIGNQYFFE